MVATKQLKPPKLIVIVGETASGKSALAMDLARKFNGEVINADSRQIYKGMDIGTAKPTEAEQAEIPHHLLDVVEPNQPFSAADFKRLALTSIADISARSKLPILVGGTGLYIDAILYDFNFLPPNPKLRAKLSKLTINQLLALISEQGLDMTAIDIKNKRRLVRLLETGGQRPQSSSLRSNTLIIGLKIPRAELRQRIDSRIDHMLQHGLLDEVRQMGERYGWDSEALTGIGYRVFKDVILGTKRVGEAKADFRAGDLNLAKRQRTWFKRNPNIKWIENSDQAIKLVTDFLN